MRARHFVIPLLAAAWPGNPAAALGAAAGHVMEFLTARGLLTAGRPATWRAAAGGFARFADRIARTLTTVRTGLPVQAITGRCGRSVVGRPEPRSARARAFRYSLNTGRK